MNILSMCNKRCRGRYVIVVIVLVLIIIVVIGSSHVAVRDCLCFFHNGVVYLLQSQAAQEE